MKYIQYITLYLFFCLFLSVSSVAAATDLPDSLRRELAGTPDKHNRIALLMNLTDLSVAVKPGETPYYFQLYDAAHQAGDCFALSVALPSIVTHYIEKPYAADSLSSYLNHAEAVLRGSIYDGMTTYYRMTVRARELQMVDREGRAALCERLMKFYDARKATENKYEKAERLFMSGVIAYQLLSLNAPNAITAGQPYWESEWTLIQGFNVAIRRLYAGNLISCILPSYYANGDAEKFQATSEQYLAMLDGYFSDAELLRRRPYVSKEIGYLLCYMELINAGELIGRNRAHAYYLRYRQFVYSDNSDKLLRDNTFYYSISQLHYAKSGEYPIALAYCDSLIRHQEQSKGYQTASILSAHQAKANLLRKMGRTHEACAVYEHIIQLSDSMNKQQYVDKVSEMEANFGMEKLQTTMQVERKQNLLVFALFVLIVAAGIGVYLYFSLRRERQLKSELHHQYELANESDRLKTAFLNMVAHEVRTPLNVINGFVELLSSGEIPDSQQAECMNLVQEQTHSLTAMMNDMLEVVNLDNSSVNLHRETLCVNSTFREIVKQINLTNKGKLLNCTVSLPDEELFLKTHSGYFSHVFHELMENACKFTKEGSITLSCRADYTANKLICSVTDTGIGVPQGDADRIFERFSQLDTFVQGTGLGLYLCRLILNKLDGEIRLDTSYTAGARFIVTFPMQ
ncbi:MAG: HAMP domain-containing sensor histidine kinase [Alistipes sp.]